MVNFFIQRPVFATVCSLLIVLGGAVCIPTLPIAQYPNLTPPAVSVSAFYTGANSQAVETSVTTLLEQAINGAEGMRYMSSTSGNDGTFVVMLGNGNGTFGGSCGLRCWFCCSII